MLTKFKSDQREILSKELDSNKEVIFCINSSTTIKLKMIENPQNFHQHAQQQVRQMVQTDKYSFPEYLSSEANIQVSNSMFYKCMKEDPIPQELELLYKYILFQVN